MRSVLVLISICLFTAVNAQPVSKEDFLNDVIHDFVDSTFPVFYMKREARNITVPKSPRSISSLSPRYFLNRGYETSEIRTPADTIIIPPFNQVRDPATEIGITKGIGDTLFFLPSDDTVWRIKSVHKARTPANPEEEFLLSHDVYLGYSPYYTHTETEDGQILNEGYLRFPRKDWIRNQPYGRRLFVFDQPLFDSTYQYALFSAHVLNGGIYGCLDTPSIPQYLFHKEDGHWKRISSIY